MSMLRACLRYLVVFLLTLILVSLATDLLSTPFPMHDSLILAGAIGALGIPLLTYLQARRRPEPVVANKWQKANTASSRRKSTPKAIDKLPPRKRSSLFGLRHILTPKQDTFVEEDSLTHSRSASYRAPLDSASTSYRTALNSRSSSYWTPPSRRQHAWNNPNHYTSNSNSYNSFSSRSTASTRLARTDSSRRGVSRLTHRSPPRNDHLTTEQLYELARLNVGDCGSEQIYKVLCNVFGMKELSAAKLYLASQALCSCPDINWNDFLFMRKVDPWYRKFRAQSSRSVLTADDLWRFGSRIPACADIDWEKYLALRKVRDVARWKQRKENQATPLSDNDFARSLRSKYAQVKRSAGMSTSSRSVPRFAGARSSTNFKSPTYQTPSMSRDPPSPENARAASREPPPSEPNNDGPDLGDTYRCLFDIVPVTWAGHLRGLDALSLSVEHQLPQIKPLPTLHYFINLLHETGITELHSFGGEELASLLQVWVKRNQPKLNLQLGYIADGTEPVLVPHNGDADNNNNKNNNNVSIVWIHNGNTMGQHGTDINLWSGLKWSEMSSPNQRAAFVQEARETEQNRKTAARRPSKSASTPTTQTSQTSATTTMDNHRRDILGNIIVVKTLTGENGTNIGDVGIVPDTDSSVVTDDSGTEVVPASYVWSLDGEQEEITMTGALLATPQKRKEWPYPESNTVTPDHMPDVYAYMRHPDVLPHSLVSGDQLPFDELFYNADAAMQAVQGALPMPDLSTYHTTKRMICRMLLRGKEVKRKLAEVTQSDRILPSKVIEMQQRADLAALHHLIKVGGVFPPEAHHDLCGEPGFRKSAHECRVCRVRFPEYLVPLRWQYRNQWEENEVKYWDEIQKRSMDKILEDPEQQREQIWKKAISSLQATVEDDREQ